MLPSGSGTGYGQTNRKGTVVTGYQTGSTGGHLAPRIQASLQQAREKRQARMQGDDVSRRNMVVDEDGVAHDSEYVQFRTATPVHTHSARHQTAFPVDDDDSASSSSSSSGEGSGSTGFPSSPYTYQSTHRTTNSTHHYSTPLGTTASAVPGYLQPKPVRSSFDYGTSLTVPRAPSPRRSSAEYERPTSTKQKTRTQTAPQFTTSSYQPPAPAFGRLGGTEQALRLPTVARAPPTNSDTNSLSESVAKMNMDGGGSGYNQFVSPRPPKLDGSALDAGVHGLRRSWDGFALEMKFGARSVTKKVQRKMRAIT